MYVNVQRKFQARPLGVKDVDLALNIYADGHVLREREPTLRKPRFCRSPCFSGSFYTP
jgi:hypothetical protein